MTENKNENEKRIVPVITFEEFLKHESGENKIVGPFKVRKEDEEKLMKYLKNR